MTNHWIDIANSDCIMIIGSNAAENHPISFKWVTMAMESGAKLINVDPRFTRTSAEADIYAPIRPGTDIAFIGGIINYVLENELYNREYVLEYTNAPFLINENFGFDDGLFSGYNETDRKYDTSTWQYKLDENGNYMLDESLEHPNCVFQLLKKHYSRYDVDTMRSITGMPKNLFLKIAETFCSTGTRDKAGTIMYAMGATQHTVGTQNVRSYAILQLLLGNIGMAGGGINALRGESNVQGSTDYGLLFQNLPGYLKSPEKEDATLEDYFEHWMPKSHNPNEVNYWKFTSRFIVSLLKAFWHNAAHPENDFCYEYLPKRSANYSYVSIFEAMSAGNIKGLLCFGQNPAVGGPNAKMERKALENLDWLVAVDLWETETAAFWKDVDIAKAIKTEVFLLPAAASFEKEGSVTNSGRWAQWRYEAVEPPGEAKSDMWILNALYLKLKELYEREGGTYPAPILNLNWDYGEDEPNVHNIAKEINGCDTNTGKQLSSFAQLKDDGSTASGNWLYCGSYVEEGNMMARRGEKRGNGKVGWVWCEPTQQENSPVLRENDTSKIGLNPDWAWAWPINRRILYNRASCDSKGIPMNPEKPVIWWNGTEWEGDVPDYGKDTPPGADVGPFIMLPEGRARLFAIGLADGPFPEHYEPLESPVKNFLSSVQNNPVININNTTLVKRKGGDENAPMLEIIGDSERFPYIASTYRLTEHWQAGQMTRNLPWLVELMPKMFVEISESLAKEKDIKIGDMVKVISARGEITAYASVTDRMRPYEIDGKLYEQVGLPWHYGFTGLATGCSANCLTHSVGDANTMIPEYKAFLCDIQKMD